MSYIINIWKASLDCCLENGLEEDQRGCGWTTVVIQVKMVG